MEAAVAERDETGEAAIIALESDERASIEQAVHVAPMGAAGAM